tara:strand:- start:50 stop:331 length:282 start_codon:yes stop_codon:yes gene_type:complete
MSPKPDEFKMLISQYRTMDIEELKANIDHWEREADSSTQIWRLNIAKNELELKYIERQKQIELLTKSLTSSSRIKRWISSAQSVLKQFLALKN